MSARVLIDYSQCGEALALRQHVPSAGPRVLVHAGAGDGLTNSISRGFADEGWRCILLEDGPVFAALSANCVDAPELECIRASVGDVAGALPEPTPRDLGLLIVSGSYSCVCVTGSFEGRGIHPRLVVSEDTNDVRSRQEKYDWLASRGYQYGGLTGAHSIWHSGDDSRPAFEDYLVSDLPPLAEGVQGKAVFDPVAKHVDFSGITGRKFAMVSGWAIVDEQGHVPPLVWVEVSDRIGGSLTYVQAHRFFRPQSKKGAPRPNLNMSGFRAAIPLAGRPPKSYTLRVVQGNQDECFRSDGELLLESELETYENAAREGLARKFLSGSGIEIGALQRPLRLPANCRVRYIDRLALDDLVLHYPELGQHPLQAPDLLDDGERLSRVGAGSQDFVIANHFFEHSENPIETLRNLLRVLRVGGVLYMAVPDKRYTFDFLRPITQYDRLKHAFESGTRADRQELFREWVTLAERFSGNAAAERLAHLLDTNYSIHYNVWALDDLLAFLLRARADFDLRFRLVSIVSSENETIILLERT